MIYLGFDGQRFGTAYVSIFNTWEEMESGWIFPNMEGGLNHYRSQLPNATKAPVMVFDDITVYTQFKTKKLGLAGVMATMRHFREKGARVAFLRIGTQGEDWDTGKVWRQRMYENLGWKTLSNHPSYEGDVPIMWHPMEGDLYSQRVDEVTLEFVDDSPPLIFDYPYLANSEVEQSGGG